MKSSAPVEMVGISRRKPAKQAVACDAGVLGQNRETTDALERRSEETWPPRPGKREVACWIRVMRQHDEVDSRRVRRSVATELSEDLAFLSIAIREQYLSLGVFK